MNRRLPTQADLDALLAQIEEQATERRGLLERARRLAGIAGERARHLEELRRSTEQAEEAVGGLGDTLDRLRKQEWIDRLERERGLRGQPGGG